MWCSSFLPDVLLRLHDLDPSLPLGFICEHAEDAERWTALPIAAFIPHYSLVSERLIDEVHAREKKLLTWTVNDAHDLLRLAGWGVDGLISDDPRLLARTFPRQRDASVLAPPDRSDAVGQFDCHPEQASVAQRGIWACRFAPARERHASLFKLTHLPNLLSFCASRQRHLDWL